MKSTLLALVAVFFSVGVFAQVENLYHKAYGNPEHPMLLFLHDGPGGNCAEFEAKMVPEILNFKFYVIVYDRRGEGRSNDPSALHTRDEMIGDAKLLSEIYHFKELTILAEGFGANVASFLAESLPYAINSICLINAHVNQAQYNQHKFELITKEQDSPEFEQIKTEYKNLLSLDPSTFNFQAHAYCISRKLECTSQGKIKKQFLLSDTEKTWLLKHNSNPTNLEEWISKPHFNSLDNNEPDTMLSEFELYNSIEQLDKLGKRITLVYNTAEFAYRQQDIEVIREKVNSLRIKAIESKTQSPSPISTHPREIVVFMNS